MRNALVNGTLPAVTLVFLAEVLRVLAALNFHTVVAERFYRSSQPSTYQLENLIRTFEIRTVINLRGDNTGRAWYEKERVLTTGLGAAFVDAGLWTCPQPAAQDLRHLVKTLGEAQEPILIHCNSGSDRTGLASTLYRLLRTDADLSSARSELSLRYGHYRWGRAGCQDRLLDSYEAWLGEEKHTPARLHQWIFDVYQPE